jgi:hypothetical protein
VGCNLPRRAVVSGHDTNRPCFAISRAKDPHPPASGVVVDSSWPTGLLVKYLWVEEGTVNEPST